MKAGRRRPEARLRRANGYVRYQRDANADLFGTPSRATRTTATRAAARTATPRATSSRRTSAARPRDNATITTDRYRFRYDGRWLMTRIQISPDDGATYGPDLVDRWKARAFAAGPGVRDAVLRLRGGGHQLGRLVHAARRARRPGARDPRDVGRRLGHQRHPPRDLLPRGDEPEDVPARARRSRRSTASTRSGTSTPGASDTFYNARIPTGARSTAATTRCTATSTTRATRTTTTTDTGRRRPGIPETYAPRSFCAPTVPVPPVGGPAATDVRDANGGYQWSLVTGPHGSIVDRIPARQLTDLTPGGAAQSLLAVPYYRDDRASTTAPAATRARSVQAALRRRAAHDVAGRRASAGARGRRARRQRALLPGLDRDPRRAHPRGRRLRQRPPDGAGRTRSSATGGWSCCPAGRAVSAGEAYGRGFERPYRPHSRHAAQPGGGRLARPGRPLLDRSPRPARACRCPGGRRRPPRGPS